MPMLPGRVAETWVDGGGGGGGAVDSVDSRVGVVTLSDLYINLTEKAAANGVATLDAGSKIPAAQIPAIALSEYLGTVASEAAMLALVGQRGDWCIRTDLEPDSIFILENDDPTQAANWTNVTGFGVVSVDGQVGIVDLSSIYAAFASIPVADVAGTADTIAAGDLGRINRYTDAGLVTVTLPDGLAVGSWVNLLFAGAAGGAVQDNGTSVVQPEGAVEQFREVSCVVVAPDTWSVQGPVT